MPHLQIEIHVLHPSPSAESRAKGYLLPDFYSGATGTPGRFSEGLLLRRLHRIKECQLDLYADRTSTATMRANQLRLWFASMAYVLLCALRRIGLHDTDFAKATCGTIRLKLLKIGAIVRLSVRRIKIAMASACPVARDWTRAAIRLAIAALARASPA